jgi:hypothetical protein
MSAVSRKGCVTLYEKFVQAVRAAGLERNAIRNLRSVSKIIPHPSRQPPLIRKVLILNARKIVRQTVGDWPAHDAAPIIEPFADEENARHAILPHVSAQVEKFSIGDGPEKPSSQRAAKIRSEAFHRERNGAHEGFALPKVQIKRNVCLQ